MNNPPPLTDASRHGTPPVDPSPISRDELAALRADTPGVQHQNFLLSCGAALMPRPVVQAMHDYITLEEKLGGYAAYEHEQDRLEAVYGSIARLVNAGKDEIALVENATIAWQLAFHSIRFKPGDVLITAEAEYAANYVSLLQMQKWLGIEIQICPSDETGALDTRRLASMINERVRLISLTWIPTNGGLINPAAEVGRIARANNVPYLLDACQAVGQMPVDVEALGCDFLAATSRKFLRGPRGAGFLYVRRAMLDQVEPPFIDHFGAPWVAEDSYALRDDARRYESWENNYVARLGMGRAADYAMGIGLDRIEARCTLLATRLRCGLADVPGVSLRDLGKNPSAIVSFSSDRVPTQDIIRQAQTAGIVISASSPGSTRLDAERRALPLLARAGLHYFNTEDEIDALVGFIAALPVGK